ncbi:autotransporter-associated beta strand repeat protein [Pirellula staleyi DSM 6068]|uniref:Autotransporter-associated beta strand repeat protein n=1 Tax=Pirellula staleyi (strain ATCC 27377 / DSM 6068 / ICPB 4128) TaxID=530564 RepID=D2QWD4_PIRSD|nr:autotransporter-associated beta strand repeat protein [Pirellula staleyi DSM 6068]
MHASQHGRSEYQVSPALSIEPEQLMKPAPRLKSRVRTASSRMASCRKQQSRRLLLESLEQRLALDGTFHLLASSNFSQDWTNAGLITTNDDWSGVPSIIGYIGTGLASGDGVDPQTVLADGSSTAVDVNANQANPNGFGTGGVTEYAITDPTIALAGSGTANAPHIVLHLNTSGRENVTVSYRLRDLEDTSTDNSISPVAVQYRVGATGNYINLPTGFRSDVTTGPSTAAPDTLVSVVLPAGANNQSQVFVRIITTNAAGTDEMVGVDDISVTSTAAPFVIPTPGKIAGANLNVVQNDTGNNVTSVTVTTSQEFGNFSMFPGSNRGDYNVRIGSMSQAQTLAGGILITSVSQNGRDNGEGGVKYATASIDMGGTGYFIPIHEAPSGNEYNINVAAAYFPYSNFIGGFFRNDPTNNGPILAASSYTSAGIDVGEEFTQNGTGIYQFSIPGVNPLTDGILLVVGGKNEDNFGMTQAASATSWNVIVKDNDDDGGGSESDSVGLVYLPASDLYVTGKFSGNASKLYENGSYNIAQTGTGTYRLTIPGYTPNDGVLILSPEGNAGLNVDNIVSYEPDGNGWIIQTRDIPGNGLQNVEATVPVTSFAFIPSDPGHAQAPVAAANLIVVQNDTGNTPASVTVTTSEASGGFQMRPGSNRGDYNVQIGPTANDDVAGGVLISSVSQNGRDNGEGNGVVFATSAVENDAGAYFIPVHNAPGGAEWNINVAAAYFDYDDYLGGFFRNTTNGGALTVANASPGIVNGVNFIDNANGTYTVTLPGVNPLTDGVLIATGGKNEDNYALSVAATDTSWTIFNHDNGDNGAAFERDGVAFVYLPNSPSYISGKFYGDATTAVKNGAFSITTIAAGRYKLTIDGYLPGDGVLLLSPENFGNGVDNIVTYEPLVDGWEIQTRDLPQNPPTLQGMAATELVASFVFLPSAASSVGLDGSGNLIIEEIAGDTADNIILSRSGDNLRIYDPDNQLWLGAGATRIDANTIEVPLASITGNVQVSLLGNDDLLTIDQSAASFSIPGGIVYSGGGQISAAGDGLAVIGNSTSSTAVYTPSATTAGSGTILLDGTLLVSFSGLEPIDISGMLTATLATSATTTDENLTLTNGTDFFAGGTNNAILVSGTTGLGGTLIETAAFWNNTNLVITTDASIGNDTITIASADLHSNTNLSIDTGVGSDVIEIDGSLVFVGDVVLDSQQINFNTNGYVAAASVLLDAGSGAITDDDAGQDVSTPGDLLILAGAGGVNLDIQAGTLDAATTGNGNQTYRQSGAATLIDGLAAGSGTVTFATGTFNSSAANVITDTTSIALGAGATWNLSNFSETIAALSLSTGNPAGSLVATGTGTLTVGGNITLAGLVGDTASAEISGNLNLGGVQRSFVVAEAGPAFDLLVTAITSNGSVLKTGLGTLAFRNGSNSFGNTTISKGTVVADDFNNSLGTTGTITLGDANTGNDAVAFYLDPTSGGTINFTRPVTVASTGSTATATLGSNSGAAGIAFFSALVTINRDVVLRSTLTDRTQYRGGITGTGNVTINGGARTTWSTNPTLAEASNGASVFDFAGNISIEGTSSYLQTNSNFSTGASSLATKNLNVGAGAQLRMAYNSDVTVNQLTGSGTVNAYAASASLVAPSVFTIGASNGSSTFTGVITQNDSVLQLVKTGTGTITLAGTGTNNYAGGTVVSQGTLEAGKNSAFGTGTITLNDANTGANNTALIINANANGAAQTNTISNAVLVQNQGTGTTTIGTVHTSGSLGAATTFSGAFTLEKDVTLQAGQSDRTDFTGTFATSGPEIVDLTITRAAGSLGNRVIFQSTAKNINGDIFVSNIGGSVMLQIFTSNILPDSTDVDIAATSIFRLASVSETIAGLTGTGEVRANGTGNLTVGGNNASSVFDGILRSEGGSALNLIKTGTGTFQPTGANVHASNTITGGVLLIGADTNLGVASAGVTFNTGGTLRYGASFDPLTSRPFVLTGAGTIDTNGFNSTIGSLISGAGRLTKVGAGVLTLGNASNSFTGGLSINGGVISAASLAGGNGPSPIGGWLGTSAFFSFDGGTLRYTGTGASPGINRAFTINAGGATIEVTDPAATLNWTDAAGAGPIIGTGSLTKTGPGTLALLGSNSYSGGTFIVSGTVTASQNTSLGSAGVTMNTADTGASNTSLLLAPTRTLGNAITVANVGTGTTTIGSLAGSTGVATFSGAIALGKDVTFLAQNTTTQNAGNDPGQTNFTGNITGAGGVTITGGNLVSYRNNASSKSYTGTTVIDGNSRLSLYNSASTPVNSTVDIRSGSTLIAEGIGSTIGGLTGAGNLVANSFWGTSTLSVGNNSASTDFSGVASGPLNFTKIGTGTLTFSGTAANTYTGTTTVNTGTLELNKTAGVNAIAGNLAIGDGTGGANADLVRLLASNQIADTATVTVNGTSGQFNLNGFNETISVLAGAGNTTLGAGNLTLVGGTQTVSSVISGSGGLFYAPAALGNLTLAADNTFTGGVTGSNPNARFILTHANGFGTGTVTLPNYTANTTEANPAIGFDFGANTTTVVDNNIVIGSGPFLNQFTVIPNNTQVVRLTGEISGGNAGATHRFNSSGSSQHNNTFTLENSSNSFTGNISIFRGTLGVSSDGSLGNAANDILLDVTNIVPGGLRFDAAMTLGAGRTLNFLDTTRVNTNGFDVTVLGVVASSDGDNTFVKDGLGTLSLQGINTTTSPIRIDAGRLNLNGSTLAAASFTVHNGGTLGGTGDINGTVTVNTGGTVDPGLSPGVLESGSVSFAADAIFSVEIGGGDAGDGAGFHSQLDVTGTISINTAADLAIASFGGYVPVDGESYIIIRNDGTDLVTGNFEGLAEGTIISADFLGSGKTARITYQGGDGNDVAIIVDGPATFTGTAGADDFEIRRVVSGPANLIQLLLGGSVIDSRPTASLGTTSEYTINAGASDDSLFVNYGASGGLYDFPITFNGETGSDDLTIGGNTVTTIEHTYVNDSDGDIDLDGRVITYTGLAPITDNMSAANRIFTFTGGAETITLSDIAGAGISQIDSTLGELTTFTAPTSSLTINTTGGGADTLILAGIDPILAAGFSSFAINGDASDALSITGTIDLATGPTAASATISTGAISFLGGQLSADSSISLTATGAITTDTAAIDVVTTDLSMSAGTGILLDTSVTTITSATSTAGNIIITELNGLTATLITASAGSITLSTPTGNLAIGALTAVGDATLVATTGAITDANAGVLNLSANNLSATSATGIDLDTSIATLTASVTGTGAIDIDEASAITLTSITTNNGLVDITSATGTMTVTSINAAGAVNLAVTDTGAADDDIIVSGTLSSTSNVVLLAGDDATLSGTISATGTVSVTIDAASADVGGATLSFAGDIDAVSATFTGGAEIDTFNVRPDQDNGLASTPISIFGGDPTMPAGDLLVLDITGLGVPTLTLGAVNYSGVWSFGASAAGVAYSSIETVQTTPLTSVYNLVLDMRIAGFQNGAADAIEIFLSAPNVFEVEVNGLGKFSGQADTINSFTVIGSSDSESLTIRETAAGLPSFDGAAPLVDNSLASGGVSNGAHLNIAADAYYTASNLTDVTIHFDGGLGDNSLALELLTAADVGYFSDVLDGQGSGNVGVGPSGAPLTLVSFADLDTLILDGAGGNLVVDASSSTSTADIEISDDGAAADGVTEITADTGLVATTTFEGFLALDLIAGGGNEAIDLVNIDSTSSLTSIDIVAGSSLAATDNSAHTVRIHAIKSGVPVTVTGDIGVDTFQVFDSGNSASNIASTLSFNGVAGDDDSLIVVDSGSVSADSVVITRTTIEGLTIASGIDITFTSIDDLDVTTSGGADTIRVNMTEAANDLDTAVVTGAGDNDQFYVNAADFLARLTLNGGLGDDTFGGTPSSTAPGYLLSASELDGVDDMIRPSLTTPFFINGNDPSVLPGDVLNIDVSALGGGLAATSPVLVSSGQVLSSTHATVTFTTIEDLNLADDGEMTSATINDIYIRGTNGNDTIQFARANTTLEPSRTRVQIGSSYTYHNVPGKTLVYGRGGNDIINQSNLQIPAEFYGEAGDDFLTGSFNNDLLVGGLGNDRINASSGNNIVWGDDAPTSDELNPHELNIGGNDTLSALGGNDLFYAGGGNDSVSPGAGDDWIHGGYGNDQLSGSSGNDRIYGAQGNDTISGDVGDDFLSGGDGDDRLYGRDGNDVLIGGDGVDLVDGGNGNDLVLAAITTYQGTSDTATSNTYSSAVDAAMLALLVAWNSGGPVAPNLTHTDDLDRDTVYGGSGNDLFGTHTNADPLTSDIRGDFNNSQDTSL